MKRKIWTLIAVLYAAILTFSLAACNDNNNDVETPADETFAVTVDCEQHGSYVLSPQKESYPRGEEVVLHVSADDGYDVGSVKLNGSEVHLIGGAYTFTVDGDVAIEICFAKQQNSAPDVYRVQVQAGEGGSYVLSPQKENYPRGEEVVLHVSADDGYDIKSVKVDGKEVNLMGGAYTFTVEKNVTVEIGFKKNLYSSAQIGTWRTRQASGALGSEIRIGKNDLVYDGKPCSVETHDGSYSFTVMNDEGELQEYTIAFEEVYGGEILVLTTKQSVTDENGQQAEEDFEVIYYKDGVSYVADVTFDEKLIGLWEQFGAKTYGDIEITQNKVLVTSSGGIFSSVIKSYDSRMLTIILADGAKIVYENGVIVVTLATGQALSYRKGVAEEEQFFPTLAGVYAPKNYAHLLEINEKGEVYLDGVKYKAVALDLATMPDQYILENTYHLNTSGNGDMLWMYGGELGDDTVVFYRMEEDAASVTVDMQHGSFALSKEAPYAFGDRVTITLTMDKDYEALTFTLNGTNCLSLLTDGSYTFYVVNDIAIAVTAQYVKYYTVNVSCGEGGSFSITPDVQDGKIPEKTSATIKVTPDAGYEIVSFKVNGTESADGLAVGGEYAFTADAFTAKNGQISFEIVFEREAEFIPEAYLGLFRGGSKDGPQLDVIIYEDGTLQFFGNYTDTVTLSKICRGSYSFTRSDGKTGKLLLNADGTVTTSGAAVISLKSAKKVEKTYSIDTQCTEGGSVSISFGYYTAWDYRDSQHISYQYRAEGPYGEKDPIKITITVESGYTIESLLVNGVEVKADLNAENEYTFTITQDTEIEVKFAQI